MVVGPQRHVDVSLIFFPHPPTTSVARDANDLIGRKDSRFWGPARRVAIQVNGANGGGNADVLADGVLTGPELLLSRFTDDHDRRVGIRFLLGETPPADNPNAQCLEMLGGNKVVIGPQPAVVRRRPARYRDLCREELG